MPEPPRISIPRLPSRAPSHEPSPQRPAYNRSSTFEGPTRVQRDISPAPMPRLTRVPTEPSSILANRAQLRPVRKPDVFGDPDEDSVYASRTASPATSVGSGSRSASWSTYDSGANNGAKKAPPPPPPSRAKKPAPPPPMKRSALSSSDLSR